MAAGWRRRRRRWWRRRRRRRRRRRKRDDDHFTDDHFTDDHFTDDHLTDDHFTDDHFTGDHDADLDDPEQLGAAAVAEIAQNSVTIAITGTVRIRLPHSHRFVLLRRGTIVPTGAEIDATHGSVELVFARKGGGTMSVTFSTGEFITSQTRSGEAIAKLAGGNFAACRKHHPREATIARARPVRKLWAKEHGGNFGTRGKYVATSVEGTHWLTEDFCGRSEVVVAQGVVIATNVVTHRHRVIRAGHSYTANA